MVKILHIAVVLLAVMALAPSTATGDPIVFCHMYGQISFFNRNTGRPDLRPTEIRCLLTRGGQACRYHNTDSTTVTSVFYGLRDCDLFRTIGARDALNKLRNNNWLQFGGWRGYNNGTYVCMRPENIYGAQVGPQTCWAGLYPR